MNWPLARRLPPQSSDSSDQISEKILDGFLDFVSECKLELYPAQEEAILELFSGKNVILNTPTGSGKSLVATALHFNALSLGKRSIYTSPIKALVNEKFLALCRDFGPENVGMITGDAAVNSDALILCCTAEIVANEALRDGRNARISDLIMDEFHYYSDRERGAAWQIPLLTLANTRFLLMSATLGDTRPFEICMTQLNHRETKVVYSNERPVPLTFEYIETPLHETVVKLTKLGRTPIYLVSFTQRECAEEAQNFLSIDICTKDEKREIDRNLEDVRFSSPYGKEIKKLIRHGIGIHHGGLLPKYRVLVERLAQKGLLKLICGTDTLGVGVNVPIRTVLLTRLCKFDGEKSGILTVRDFQQISGRAGRKGFDNQGFVVVQAPEHVIENLRLEQKASGDPKKTRKLVKRKPPEKGFVLWTRDTFERLISGQPETLVSRFKVTHSVLLNVLSRSNEDGCKAMQELVRDCHENLHTKKQIRKVAFQLFRSLVERRIIQMKPLRVNVDLQEDFSLNHALSLYLLDSLKLLDQSHVDYALDVVTLVESILENPDLILRKQLDRVKDEKMQEMKLDGVEYDDRIAELEKLEYPKPRRDFIYDTFNVFSAAHPWVGQENVRPKSVAREMYESFHSFAEYIREYQLQRAEGLLLRYLSDVYKTLVQTVPDSFKSDEVFGVIDYLGSMVRQVDSSLIDEWERLKNPNWIKLETSEVGSSLESDARKKDIVSNIKEFRVLVGNEIFRVLRAIASKDYETAISIIHCVDSQSETVWSVDKMALCLEGYYSSDHSRICTDTRARSPSNTLIRPDKEGEKWSIQQILIDPLGHNDWTLDLIVDLDLSRQSSKPVLILEGIRSL